jgi:hypothetical protein
MGKFGVYDLAYTDELMPLDLLQTLFRRNVPYDELLDGYGPCNSLS